MVPDTPVSLGRYAFLQVFNKYGKISKLDFLFHKTGPHKGKPRGYAFVEYAEKEVRLLHFSLVVLFLNRGFAMQDALRALVNAHDKLLRGRKVVVTFAHQTHATDANAASRPYTGKSNAEMSRPTALSLLKTSSHLGKYDASLLL